MEDEVIAKMGRREFIRRSILDPAGADPLLQQVKEESEAVSALSVHSSGIARVACAVCWRLLGRCRHDTTLQ
jgi:hypothetical protein